MKGEQAVGLALRGGSWNNHHDNARVAERNNDHPDNEWNNNGFRVAALHGFAAAGSAFCLWIGVEAKLAGLFPGRGGKACPAKHPKALPVLVAAAGKGWARPGSRQGKR
ncbi:MAG TPA: hypothetical protein PKM21_10225 [Anaerolineales bacterium]|nr:hypothetical protein [Anaerolineales bacterium]